MRPRQLGLEEAARKAGIPPRQCSNNAGVARSAGGYYVFVVPGRPAGPERRPPRWGKSGWESFARNISRRLPGTSAVGAARWA